MKPWACRRGRHKAVPIALTHINVTWPKTIILARCTRPRCGVVTTKTIDGDWTLPELMADGPLETKETA